ncbi:MAG: hypothetical protein HFH24_10265 [Ruminococcus sp.]|nr:hypothetical protein [Ruminococcus sp.]
MKFELFEMLRYIDTHLLSDGTSCPPVQSASETECPDKDTKEKKEFYDLLPQMTPSDLFQLYLHLRQEESSAQKRKPTF